MAKERTSPGPVRRALARLFFGKSWESYLMRRMGATGSGLDEGGWTFRNDSDYLHAMERSATVFACIGAIADAVTRPRWWFEKASGESKEQARTSLPELAGLLHRPNRYVTGRELLQITVVHMLLTGKAYWYLSEMTALSMFETKTVDGQVHVKLDVLGKPILRNPENPIAGGQPKEIWYLQPDRVRPVAGGPGELFKEFVYEPNPGQKFTIPADAMIYFRRLDPNNMTDGLGVIEAARMTLETDRRAEEWNNIFFKNSARPDGLLVTDQPLTEAEIERYMESWKKDFQGQDRAHRMGVLGGGLKWQPLGIPPKDMEFLLQRKFSREAMLMMFRVPPAKVGLFEYANYANAREQDAIFWAGCMEPILTGLADRISVDLVSRYDSEAALVFQQMVKADLLAQSQIIQRLVVTGVWSQNEARAEFGLGPAFAGGDIHAVPAGYVVIGRDRTAEGVPALAGSTGGDGEGPPIDTGGDGQEPAALPAGEGGTGQDTGAGEGQPTGAEAARTAGGGQSRSGGCKGHIHAAHGGARRKGLPVEEIEKIERAFRTDAVKSFQEQESAFMRAMLESEELAELAGDKAADRRQGKAAGEELELVERLIDWDGHLKVFKERFYDRYQGVIQTVGEQAIADLGVDLAFDVENPLVADWMEGYVPRLAGEVTEETRSQIAHQLAEGLRDGESVPHLRDRVREVFREAKSARAEMIARSETARASTMGDIAGWDQSGVVAGKKWLLAPDACEFCVDIAGEDEMVGLTDLFASKGDDVTGASGADMTLDYEDVMGPPLHPNCRCSLEAVLSEIGGGEGGE